MTSDDSPNDVASTDTLSFTDFADDLSRRGLLGNAAKAGVGAVALGAFGMGNAAADHKGMEGASIPEILNYALTLERLEATYYENALAKWSESEVERSATARQFAEPSLQYSVYNHFEDVAEHEMFHVELLEGALDSLGADVTAPSSFSFPEGAYDSVGSFVELAQTLEDTGVAAYAGVAPQLVKAELATVDGDVSKLELAPAALGIHSIEARHAGYFHTLNERRPWPAGEGTPVSDASIDDPKTMDEVVSAVKPFLGE
jgi:hypothetical protein